MADAIRVTLADVKGSAPREAGTAMLVWANRIEGTIGGGALEWEAMKMARSMLEIETEKTRRSFALGPALGQCCGGAVVLEFARVDSLPRSDTGSVWVWGAGHVGRALVQTLAPIPSFKITWVDTARDRFPETIPHSVDILIDQNPTRLMTVAPKDAHHVILTYSHQLDLELCHAALTHDFASCGVIGSATKWARFRKRLAQLGHSNAQISRIMCPIGDPSLGKHPQAIAIGTAARLLERQLLQESANAQDSGGT